MTAQELYELGEKAYNAEQYEEALKYYTQAAPENADAAASIPFCHINLAAQVSVDASNHARDTEYLVKGQQLAVKVLDTAVRSSLALYRDYPDYPYVTNVAGMAICQALNTQYSLVSTGLTTAYNITNTTTHIRRTVEKTTIGGTVVNEEVLWEEVIGQETESFISLNSYDMSDYHIFGPDEKTKRVKASLQTILNNAICVTQIMECIGRPFDANMLRASMACAMAEADGGDRSLLLAAEWFIAKAKEQAREALTDSEILENWTTLHESTTDSYQELSRKYAALLRTYRKKGQKPYLSKFYAPGAEVPVVESSAEYAQEQQVNQMVDAHLGSAGDVFQVFLTVFAQISFVKIFPTILFASIISLFCGGLFNVFSGDAGTFGNIFGIIWFIVTVVLTFFRTVTDADEFRTNNTFKIYMATMMGTALLFSINFFVGLVAYLVLRFLSKKYE